MSRYETDLWKELESLQNKPCNQDRDILTVTGFMDNEAFEQHVIRIRENS